VSDDPRSAEGTGETVGEARWAAARELERRFPGLDRDDIDYQVLSEGERGLMGVGREPARVLARAVRVPEGAPARVAEGAGTPAAPAVRVVAEGPVAARAAEVLEAICVGVGVPATIAVERRGEELIATLEGDDLGLVIGKHGHTIDAIQYLVNAIVLRGTEGATPIVVDAQGYRERRDAVLRDTAERAAREALDEGRAITLEPMSSAERKAIHLHLQDRDDVVTESSGREPRRCVVVRPASR
jgi:spoIIIJ-associated protein